MMTKNDKSSGLILLCLTGYSQFCFDCDFSLSARSLEWNGAHNFVYILQFNICETDRICQTLYYH